MIPDQSLSLVNITGDFILAKKYDVVPTLDYEDGGIAIDDISKGNQYQVWRGQLIGDDIILDAPEAAPVTVYSGANITEISFTFDHNMRPAVAFVQDGIGKLRWYDTSIPGYDVIIFAGIYTPRIVMDDKRLTQDANKDMILAYIRNHMLCYRQQRDRFLIEYILSEPLYNSLIKMGMNNKLRMQFLLKLKTPISS
jgi:hypothetical protein